MEQGRYDLNYGIVFTPVFLFCFLFIYIVMSFSRSLVFAVFFLFFFDESHDGNKFSTFECHPFNYCPFVVLIQK